MRITLLIIIWASVLFAAEVFKDNNTGLIWQDNSDVQDIKRDWNRVKAYCTNLTLYDNNDWRLPTIKELQSIVDIKKANPAIKDGIVNVNAEIYWSSTPDVSNSLNAWLIYFSNGEISWGNKSDAHYVRCVRSTR
jgi:hypothetical protein